MRLFHLIVVIPIAVIAAAFAVSNLEQVGFELWPLPYVLEAPLFLGVFGGIVLGFLGGAVVMWNGGRRWRRLARTRDDELRRANREIASLKEQDSRRSADARAMAETPRPGTSGALPAPEPD
ncbi:MAG: DUF1049 domain-containing protein [Proteobacteria bacterium]|nr:DUF1049 domain-containing protein [Pseudomonadota bacterium]